MTIDTSKEAVERHLTLDDNHEAGLIPMATQILLRALAAERDAQAARTDAAEAEVARLTAELEVRIKQRDANALTLEAYRKAQETVLADNKRLTAANERMRQGIWKLHSDWLIRDLTQSDFDVALQRKAGE